MKHLVFVGTVFALAACSADATVASLVKSDKAFEACEAAYGRLFAASAEIVERTIEGASTRYVVKFVQEDGGEVFPEVTCHFERGRLLTEQNPVFTMESMTINHGREQNLKIWQFDSDLRRRNVPTIKETLEELSLDVIHEADTSLRQDQS